MMNPQDTRIVFFGGAMHRSAVDAVVRLADAGFDVTVADHDPREAVELRDAGLDFVGKRSDALAGRQVVITCLTGPDQVEDLYLGDDGLLELMDPGTYAIDLSFSTMQLAREIQAMGAISDIEVLDAPLAILGEAASSVLFVGGTPEAQEALSPLFPYLATTVIPQGGAGEGQLAAAIAYISFAGSLMGTVEALALAHSAGYPDGAAVNLIATTAGGSRALVDYASCIVERDYSGALEVEELLDALDTALATAEGLELTAPMTETAYQLYELLSVVGGGELGVQALALLYEDEKTCAEHGLRWELADGLTDDEDDEDDFLDGLFDDLPGDGPHGGGMPGCPPSFGGFFSKN